MDTPTYPVTITIGGSGQTTDSGIGSVMPRVINTRQSGRLIVTAQNHEGQPFSLADLDGMDVKAKPYNTSDLPVTLGTGVVSGTNDEIFTVEWVRDSFPAGWSSFAQDRDGSIVIYIELEETGVADYYQWATRVNMEDGDYVGDAATLPLVNILFYYNPTYFYSNDTTATDPGDEMFKLNDATIANATEMYVGGVNVNNVDFSSLLSSIVPGTYIYASNPNISSDAALFQLSGTPVDNGGWFTLPITVEDSGTISFTNGTVFSLNFVTVSAGDVTGPGASTDTAIARWNGTGGDALADGQVTLDGAGGMANLVSIAGVGGAEILVGGNFNFQNLFALLNVQNLSLTDYVELTINAGAVTATQLLHLIDTENDDPTDDLETINFGSSTLIFLKLADATRIVTLVDGTGNLDIGEDVEMTFDTIYPLVWNGSSWNILGGTGGGTDDEAIHVNVAGEIAAIADKPSITLDDVVVIEDSADSNNKKSQTLRTQRQDVSNGQAGAAYQLLISDAGQTVRMSNAAANTVTIPEDATEDIPINSVIVVGQVGDGSTTIQADTGVTLNGIVDGSLEIANRYSYVVLTKVAADEWEASATNVAAIQGRIDSAGNVGGAPTRIPILVDGEQINMGFDGGTDLVTIQIKGRYLITHNFVKNNDANTAEVFVGLNGTPTLGNNIGRSYITVLAPTVNGGGMLSFSNVVALEAGDEIEFYLNSGEIAGGPQDFNWWSITKIN